jgi:hypothetical protein
MMSPASAAVSSKNTVVAAGSLVSNS